MNTKNQRIAFMLDFMAKEFVGIGNQMDEIRKILLEKESVVAATKWVQDELPFRSEPHTIVTTPTIAKSTDNKIKLDYEESAADRRAVNVKDRLVELNNLAKGIEEKKTPTVTQPDKKKDPIHLPSYYYGVSLSFFSPYTNLLLIRENCNSLYYKIFTGVDKGAVLRFNKKTRRCTLDGAFDMNRFKFKLMRFNRIKHSFMHIGCVSCDQDGRDYVNNVIRKALNKVPGQRVKIVRMYRPRGHTGHYSHCDLYLK
jgi:hypothetical protein